MARRSGRARGARPRRHSTAFSKSSCTSWPRSCRSRRRRSGSICRTSAAPLDESLSARWEQIFKERSEVLKALEGARSRNIIGHSLDAKVLLHTMNGTMPRIGEMLQQDEQRAEDILIVSQGAV